MVMTRRLTHAWRHQIPSGYGGYLELSVTLLIAELRNVGIGIDFPGFRNVKPDGCAF